jgi:phosphogluconate dehydratase
VALVTDGRMSGASGKVPAAIHVTPEAKSMAARSPSIRDGDIIGSTPIAGTLEVLVPAGMAERRTGAPISRQRVRHGPRAVRALPPRRRRVRPGCERAVQLSHAS